MLAINCFERSLSICRILLLSSLLFRIGLAENVVVVQGIGTSLPGTTPISTRVERARFSKPMPVVVGGINVCEIRGMVSGVGRGGVGVVSRAANSHYQYNIPCVARRMRPIPPE